ncbi:MAG: serine hydrolase [Chloroflexota bacterium]
MGTNVSRQGTRGRSATARRLGSLVLSAALALAAVGITVTPAFAESTSAVGDESVAVPTAWASYSGLTVPQITSRLGTTYRLVDLREDPAGGTYSGAMVANTGAYAVTGWWWYVHATVPDVTAAWQANNGRLISLEQNGDGTVNVVMVSNTGSAARSWWWYVNLTTSQVMDHVIANNGRLVSVAVDPSGTTYSVIMVPNTGADARTWFWYVGQSPSSLNDHLNANQARLVDLDVDPSGNLTAVMVAPLAGETFDWRWYYGYSAARMKALADDHGDRIVDLTPYQSGLSTLYAGLMVNVITPEPRRIQQLLENGYAQQGLTNGRFGFYVRQVGGSYSLGLQPSTTFEPASAIKALYNLYAEFQVQIGNDGLSSRFNYWYDPGNPTNKDVCPLTYSNGTTNRTTTTLENGLKRMMQVSDNRTTQGVDLRYGRAGVNGYAQVIGMRSTVIAQTLGCGTWGGGSVATTLTDLSRLYAGVKRHQLLTTTRAGTFFARMTGGTLPSTDPLATMIRREAKALGKSNTQATAFIGKVTLRDKGGSYDVCPPSGPCSAPYVYDRSDAGYITLPFKSKGVLTPRTYTYGWWVNDLMVPCAFGATCSARTQADAVTRQIRVEELRVLIRAALKTW